jgi:hypothetical protein
MGPGEQSKLYDFDNYLYNISYNNKSLQEIDDFSKPRFGTLSVRVGYWQGKLSVEVIAASNLVPVDDSFNILKLFKKKEANNDPFVEIEIQPEHFFSDVCKLIIIACIMLHE